MLISTRATFEIRQTHGTFVIMGHCDFVDSFSVMASGMRANCSNGEILQLWSDNRRCAICRFELCVCDFELIGSTLMIVVCRRI